MVCLRLPISNKINVFYMIQNVNAFKDLTHFLKVVSAEMKNETPKVVEIAIRTFQNSLFLCFYMLETATVAF